MRILVGYASKHGATDEIAHEIGRVLTEMGLNVKVAALDAKRPAVYDAYVIGSGIYTDAWLKPARDFLHAHQAQLQKSHVWLFSSGPVGRPLKPTGDPVGVEGLVESIRPEDHMVFAGKLDTKQLNFLERAIVKVFKAETGDFRDWEAVRRWATDEIAPKLTEIVTAGNPGEQAT